MIMVLIYQIIIFSIVVAVKGNRLVLGVLCLWTMTQCVYALADDSAADDDYGRRSFW